MRFLGLDFGIKKIGIAVGQSITMTATALPVVYYSKISDLLAQLDKVVGQWDPEGMVVGLPYRLDGRDSTVTVAASDFHQKLETHYAFPIYQSDEALTTLTVRNYFRQKHPHKKLLNLDSYAACLILEGWLNQNAKNFS